MIAIGDYGAGNLNSVKAAFDHLGVENVVTNKPAVVSAADRIVLPGVGHFSALSVLDPAGLRGVLLEVAHHGTPFLGICLGMQCCSRGVRSVPRSKEQVCFPAPADSSHRWVKSPHVGWNSLSVREGSRLLREIAQDSFVYYSHSFQAPVVEETIAATEYGLQFSAVVERMNVFGVQFHPEKSGEVGAPAF